MPITIPTLVTLTQTVPDLSFLPSDFWFSDRRTDRQKVMQKSQRSFAQVGSKSFILSVGWFVTLFTHPWRSRYHAKINQSSTWPVEQSHLLYNWPCGEMMRNVINISELNFLWNRTTSNMDLIQMLKYMVLCKFWCRWHIAQRRLQN